ncbi:hypothetical protein R1sor_000499 [Riccia sorocarpa]|uniref:Reverse transcriptase domain-containing protein n=1 Tax=Riccia sorocarpa TaxID=122646 RepID=A0ABD3GWC3_9MARC
MSKTIPVSEWGTCGSGYVVWVKTHLNGQEVGIINLHAPNKRQLRIQMWRWLADRIHTGNWIICGDFNQVAHIRDPIGPSPRMRGTEERVWTNISQKRDLADCYFDAASRSGPRFTRQAKCGRRLDRSRLDRVYVTDSGMWLNHIASIKHFGGHIAGDHIPICATLQLTAAVNNITIKPQSYFKLNASVLKQREVRDKIKAIWADHPPGCTDARRRWSLAWARVKDFCRDLHRAQTDQHNIRELQKEVENRRRFLPYDCSEEDIQELSQLEQELNTIEDQEASLWYLRSHSKWLREREAPTRYFFNLAKSRFSKDRISGFQKDNGEFVTGQTDILQMVECYYSDLYNAENESLESRIARQEVMRLIDKRIPESEGDNLCRPPTDDEIDATVKSLKRGKAHGLDGITNDMIIDCWEFIRQDCIEMVKTFWDRKILLHHDSQGCIKLLAKNDEKQWIKNWRPITLMSCTYKIISKLVANMMKPLLPYLIDPEQSGFVPGRKIDDNILSLRLAEEWGKVSGDSNLFVKLDFTKAFDRVSFTFLWHTLRSMGFPEDFIARIRGLMTGGTSKVHVNQAFTSAIKIKRGVRQGCPLAPLLFALSTQPLMCILRVEEEKGSLRGITLPGMQSVLHELFADDTSLFIQATARNFQHARACIEKFERASGASLNVQKSLVMALGQARHQGWLRDLGCEIAGQRRRFRYLGVWSGKGVSQKEVIEQIVLSIERKFKLWANRYITFTSRLLLIKHVLSAIPSHHLMTVGLNSKGLAKINTTTRQFLWGFAEEGRPKTSLIAWHKLHRSLEEGGLGWTDIQIRMESHLAHKIIRLLKPDEFLVGWMRLTKGILLHHCSRSTRQDWSLQEILVLSKGLYIKHAPTLSRILRCWFKAKKMLSLKVEDLKIPYHFSYTKMEAMLGHADSFPLTLATKARKCARKLKWNALKDMLTDTGHWKSTVLIHSAATWSTGEEDSLSDSVTSRTSSRELRELKDQLSCVHYRSMR